MRDIFETITEDALNFIRQIEERNDEEFLDGYLGDKRVAINAIENGRYIFTKKTINVGGCDVVIHSDEDDRNVYNLALTAPRIERRLYALVDSAIK